MSILICFLLGMASGWVYVHRHELRLRYELWRVERLTKKIEQAIAEIERDAKAQTPD